MEWCLVNLPYGAYTVVASSLDRVSKSEILALDDDTNPIENLDFILDEEQP